jgi:amino acid efflux transporter
VGLLIVVVAVAAGGSAGSARSANWTPFAPHGWLAVGHAAQTLLLSFVGWEAVAPLTTRFADPSRSLARVAAITLAVTTALYLGLAVATIGVLGPRAVTLVPLAGLLTRALGPAGTATAVVVVTLGTTNAYINGAAAVAEQLSRSTRLTGDQRPAPRFLAAIAASGLLLISLYGLGVASPASLVAIPTALFLAVYLGCVVSTGRVLGGAARRAAAPAAVAVVIMLAYCGCDRAAGTWPRRAC